MHRAVGPVAPGDHLFDAARNNNIEQVKKLIGKGNVDKVDKDGRSALWWAGGSGHKELVKALLNLGADEQLDDFYGMNSLFISIQYGQLEVVKIMMEAEEERQISPPAKRAKKTKERAKLVDCIHNGGTFHQTTPLHFAARFNHAEICSFLLDHGADINGTRAGASVYSPLMLAAEVGQIAAVKVLLARGADLTQRETIDQNQVIHIACRAKQTQVVKLLLQAGADPAAKGENGNSALHYAAQSGSGPIAKLLLEHSQTLLDHKNDSGQLPLHMAAACGRDEVLKILLEKADKSHLSVQNARLEIALHESVASRRFSCFKLLLDAGSDLKARCEYNQTLLHRAAAYGAPEIVQYLLQHDKESLLVQDANGNTPLQIASSPKVKKLLQQALK